jgi:hypothetical protein
MRPEIDAAIEAGNKMMRAKEGKKNARSQVIMAPRQFGG